MLRDLTTVPLLDSFVWNREILIRFRQLPGKYRNLPAHSIIHPLLHPTDYPRASRSYTLRVIFEGYEALLAELTAECDEDNANSSEAGRAFLQLARARCARDGGSLDGGGRMLTFW